jgi:hypothetical protein
MTPPLIPRSVLFGNPTRLSPMLSPSGDRLAYLAPGDGPDTPLMIWVGTPGLADFRPVTSDGGGVLAFCWAHDERHLLYIQDHDGDENTHLFAADAITGRVRDLTPFDGVQASIVALTPDIPGTLLVGLNRRDPQLHDVYRLDLADGELELVEENPGFSGWIADRKLRLVAALAPGTGGGADIMVPDGPVGSWRPLYRVEHADIAAFAVCGVTDGGDLIVVSAKDARAARLIRLVPGTGEVQVLYEDAAGFDVAGVDLHPVSGQPRLVFVDRLRRDIEVLPSASEVDPALRAVSRGPAAGSHGRHRSPLARHRRAR